MKHKTSSQVTIEFLKFADVKDPDYYIKFQLAQKLIADLTKEELEKLFKFEVLDYRTFDFDRKYPEYLKDKMRMLATSTKVEYSAEIKI